MSPSNSYDRALEKFREALATVDSRKEVKDIIEHRDVVFKRYQPIFTFENIPQLSEESFRSFLYFENNHHWSGLYRHGKKLTANMTALRKTLSVLLDSSRPLAERYNEAIISLKGFGKAVATAILLVNSPDEYGVWNNTSKAALKALDILPEFPTGSDYGEKYEEINKLLLRLAKDLGIDLWTLDALMWAVIPKSADEELEESVSQETVSFSSGQKFGLERHLQDFLFDNWDHTALGKEWEIYSEPDDNDAGYEYTTSIGRIDLLARHRKKSEWLVIELKRGQSSDETVGQVSRYMGWVRHNLAEKDDVVRGLIISHDADPSIFYSIAGLGIDTISVQTYELEFHLKPANFNL